MLRMMLAGGGWDGGQTRQEVQLWPQPPAKRSDTDKILLLLNNNNDTYCYYYSSTVHRVGILFHLEIQLLMVEWYGRVW